HGHDMSLLVLDIDNFKVVNDTHGHPAGDAVLVQFANVVQSLLRKNDIYARVGGEEFAILLFKINLEDAYLLAEKLRTLIEVIDLEYKDQIINLSTSIGVVQIKEEDQDFEALFNRADKALYEAKQNGRNQTVKGY
ncbi:MAG: GGDEF domain-containing protein, partial [Thiovulaceae bacterium]|nr:GGDEF domain-containing protein [Sulfurimonadaceae bacterium]